MLTGNTQFEYELHKLIDAEIERLKDCLTSISTIPDYSTYVNYVGQIRGLERIADYCNEVNTILSKR